MCGEKGKGRGRRGELAMRGNSGVMREKKEDWGWRAERRTDRGRRVEKYKIIVGIQIETEREK